MSATRRLTAILAADVVGYSRLMGEAEAGTARAPPAQRGAALGFVTNIGMAAGGVSPVLAGYFAQSYSMETVWVAAAVVMAASCLLLPLTLRSTAISGKSAFA